MYLAGLRIPDDDVRELAKLVDEPTRSFLEKSLGMESEVVALTIDDRERILWALDALVLTRWLSSEECSCRNSSGVSARGWS
jgi:hypothetical protein